MITVAAFYRFHDWPDFADHQAALQQTCDAHGVYGTILVASEGINGTIAGSPTSVAAALAHIRAIPGFDGLEHKASSAPSMPFHRMKVRLKREIVTMGVPDLKPMHTVGEYLDPEAWNALITEPNVAVIDVRNTYEIAIGAFEGAIDPKTESFRDFPEWLKQFRTTRPDAKLAMYCTGGIRCEKATSLALAYGAKDVFHLKGGILKYLENTPSVDLWRGECFVFDQRVSVGPQLKTGSYDQCHACRRPISAHDKDHPAYVEGVSCPHCIGEFAGADRARFAERQRQVELADSRGVQHIGTSPNTTKP